MFRIPTMATRLANQIQTLVRAIPSFGEGPTFAESDELEFEPGTNRVFRHGESRQDLHSAAAHDLHMAGPEGTTWPPVRSRSERNPAAHSDPASVAQDADPTQLTICCHKVA